MSVIATARIFSHGGQKNPRFPWRDPILPQLWIGYKVSNRNYEMVLWISMNPPIRSGFNQQVTVFYLCMPDWHEARARNMRCHLRISIRQLPFLFAWWLDAKYVSLCLSGKWALAKKCCLPLLQSAATWVQYPLTYERVASIILLDEQRWTWKPTTISMIHFIHDCQNPWGPPSPLSVWFHYETGQVCVCINNLLIKHRTVQSCPQFKLYTI